MCPGIGPTKVRRLHDTFHEPFRKALRVPAAQGAAPAAAAPPAAGAVQQVGGDEGFQDGPGEEPLPLEMPLEEDEGDGEDLAGQVGYEQ